MTDLAALRALHDAVKAGGDIHSTGPLIYPAFGDKPEAGWVLVILTKNSLDAAHALHKAVLPGWDFSVGAWPIQGVNGFAYLTGWQQGETDAEADTPARAWLLAILAALIAQEEGE